jgi:hypothetical protein
LAVLALAANAATARAGAGVNFNGANEMTAMSILFCLAALASAYWLLLRPVLRRRAALHALYDRLDAIEATAWGRTREYVRGLKTRLAARFVGLAAVLLAAHDFLAPFVAGVDWTPVTAELPPWTWPLVLLALSVLFSWLRSVTDGPPADAKE